ncbi:MAG TPA: DUF4136 domain-containing protein [Ramlibacter sp.]|nr:DUF4136 domain-containing protein [Ramlibacter sp.]
MRPFRHHHLLALSLAAMLGACASTPREATVQVFTAQPRLAAGSTYRYERLPSQAAQPHQAELEAAADTLLARAGLRRDDRAARLAVQLTTRQDQVSSGWGWGGPAVGIGIGGGSWGSFGSVGLSVPIGGGGAVRSTQQVDVQLRDLSSGQVVFQAQASGSSGVSAASLLQAALRDFPNMPPGTRQVPLGQATGP